jgi:hypothetical protein
MQVSSARPSHNYALQQAHETLLLGTDDLGTQRRARFAAMAAAASRLRSDYAGPETRHETNRACQHFEEPSCDRESMYIVPPHAFYRASGKVLGGFLSFSVEELARFAKSWPCRAR